MARLCGVGLPHAFATWQALEVVPGYCFWPRFRLAMRLLFSARTKGLPKEPCRSLRLSVGRELQHLISNAAPQSEGDARRVFEELRAAIWVRSGDSRCLVSHRGVSSLGHAESSHPERQRGGSCPVEVSQRDSLSSGTSV